MTAVTSTVNIKDDSVWLTNKAGGDPDYEFPRFNLPGADLTYSPTVWFRIDRDWGLSTLELFLNDVSVYKESGNYGDAASNHEQVDPARFKATNNKLVAVVTDAPIGTIRISDVMVTFRVNV